MVPSPGKASPSSPPLSPLQILILAVSAPDFDSGVLTEPDSDTMSDSKPKPPSIPSPSSPPADNESSPSPSSDDAPAPTTRQELLNQASKFLEDDSIRDSSTDRKVSFLESKGLSSDEIQQLLGVSRNPEASSSSSSPTQSDTTSSAPAATPSSTTTMSQPPSTTAATTSASRDVPPIITYPEFLLQPAKPPPLVTMRSILYTLYGAAGLGASIYGASEYLVKPMLANLTSARQELSSTAQENLQKLNEKLEQNVSVIPAHLTARKNSADGEDEEFRDDGDSVTSDPTELFHRDIGTQTTPGVSPSPGAIAKDENPLEAPAEAVNHHASRLASIQSQLKEITDLDKKSGTADDAMRSRLTDLHHYLDGLIYAAPTYTAAGGSYSLYGNPNSGGDSGSTGVRKSEDDAIASFKAEIRGVKGALLSARNFPASRGGRLGAVSPGVR